MVGHTHIIIDQIFGVITVNLRGKEILLPEDLMSLINGAMAKNPQYEAQPVQWLHSIWDFWDWTKQMKVYPSAAEGIFKRQGFTDMQGKYRGMQDYLFNHNEAQLALLQYREEHDFPLRPHGSPGIPIIQQFPSGPPKLDKIAPYHEWGRVGTKTFQETVNTYMTISYMNRTIQEEARIVQTWEQHVKDIPVIPDLLKPEYKLVFEDFEFQVALPRLMHDGDSGTEHLSQEDIDAEQEWQIWKEQRFAGHRTEPFPYDPVVSRCQSATQMKKAKLSYEEILMCGVGPTTSPQSLVIGGKHAFVTPVGDHGIYLVKIEDIGRMKTPKSVDVNMHVSKYVHTPNPNVSGFFGTFKPGTVRDVGKLFVTREQVLVYNVDFNEKTKMVSLESLRALATKLPDQYPIPASLPASHSPEDSSDEDEDGFNFVMRPDPPKNKNKNGNKNKKKNSKPKNKKATLHIPDSDEESEAEEEEEEEDDDDSDDGEEDEEGDAPVVAPDGYTKFEPKEKHLVMVNMLSEHDKRKYPADLAYVEKIVDGMVHLRWFGDFNWSTPKSLAKEKVTWHKYWPVSNSKDLCKMLGISKKSDQPTRERVEAVWSKDSYEFNSGVFIPLNIPVPGDDVEAIWNKDTVALSGEFLKNQVVPACIAAGCVKGAE